MKTLAFLTIVAFLSLAPQTNAAIIEYVATDLADTTPGQDLWRYDYSVSGRTFLQTQFVDIYFNPARFSNLTAGPNPNADWDVAVLQQPNPANFPPFDVGILDLFALSNDPSLTGLFSVTFVYLGGGAPGSQNFDVFDSAGSVLASSVTTEASSVVPEPSALLPLGVLLPWLAFRANARSRATRK